MLHHTNTDRLWAYWQAIRPSEASLKNSYSGGARFSSRSGTTITPDTPLHPFFANSQGRFHTPKSVQSIKGFNYAYEGLEYWKKSDSKMRTDATAIINKLYSDGVTRPMMLKRGEGDVGEVLEEAVRYFAQIQVDVEELERPCEIKVFVGDHLAGELIVLQQPEKGTVNGKFALDDAPEANPVDTHDDITEEVVEDILSLIKVEITKVRLIVTLFMTVTKLLQRQWCGRNNSLTSSSCSTTEKSFPSNRSPVSRSSWRTWRSSFLNRTPSCPSTTMPTFVPLPRSRWMLPSRNCSRWRSSNSTEMHCFSGRSFFYPLVKLPAHSFYLNICSNHNSSRKEYSLAEICLA